MNQATIVRAFGRSPAGLLGMLVLVVAAEYLVSRRELAFGTVTSTNWSYSRRQARRMHESGQILCYGTSLLKFGMVPRIVEAETGVPAFNLAVCNGNMASSYYLFKQTLDSGSTPAAVVLDTQEGPVAKDKARDQAQILRENRRYWPELLRFRECVELSVVASDARFFAEWSACCLLTTYKARFEIRNYVLHRLNGRANPGFDSVVAALRNWSQNRGCQVQEGGSLPRKPTPLGKTSPEAAEKRLATHYQENPLADQYLERFFQLAASRQIPVFLVLPPVSTRIQAGRDQEGVSIYHSREAEAIQRKFSNVTVVDGRRSNYPDEVYFDDVHLGRRGAYALSSDLGKVIRRRLQSARAADSWVKLSPFREPSESIARTNQAEPRPVAR